MARVVALDFRRDELGLRSETVRRANLGALARELHQAGPLSRSELGARTGLTRSAIRGLIGEFAAADLVTESGPAPVGTPGRPSVLVSPNRHRPVALAFEIDVDSIAAAAVGFGGEVLARQRVDRPRGELSVEQTVRDLTSLSKRLDGFTSGPAEAVGVGVAVVGVVRHSDGLVSVAPNLGWRDVPLGRALRRALGAVIPIAIANEADLGALAEARRGAGRGSSHLLYVQGEVGVGGGVIVDGRPLSGVAGYGGEIGHLRLIPDGGPCHCGSRGCWETEIGEDALLARAGYPRGGGRNAVERVLAEARNGRVQAVAAVEHIGRWLGVGLASLVNLLNPERIVLGGRFARLYPLFADTIERQLDEYALAAPRALVSVLPAELGEDAPLLGAAELAFEPFLTDPAAWLRPRSAIQHDLASA